MGLISAKGEHGSSRNAAPEETRFLILSTARSGTNLAIELLKSHPDCFCGYEIFSQMHVANNHIPWPLEPPADLTGLSELRRADPVALIDRLDRLTRERGYKAVGFKLMYQETDETPAARDYLLDNPTVRVFHIHRRNALRRLVSLRRAEQTGNWFVEKGQETGKPPPVHISLLDLLWDMDYVRKRELAYGRLDETHSVLHLTYEEMVGDLAATARQMWSFLGLREWNTLNVRTVKTGNDPLPEAIANYGELREQIAELASFFD
jgi:LPS sulfotransferase NodH